jgi:pyrroline-5-carboxylate reductase
MKKIVFIGGGNMASAIIGGLLKSGRAASDIFVLEPNPEQRSVLQRELGVITLEAPGSIMQRAESVVWAVKPQHFHEAARSCAEQVGSALHLSVMAGIRSDTMASALGNQRLVRAMPNTPALVGRGITGLFACPQVSDQERLDVEHMLSTTGATLWVEQECDLDAVTALSGSGPAYVFYFVEAMIEAAQTMGLSEQQGRQLALATFGGATTLAQASDQPPQFLRERVTSKGGTTQAAMNAMEQGGVKKSFIKAILAAHRRAEQLGHELARAD